MAVVDLDPTDWARVIDAPQPVVVLFWAPWSDESADATDLLNRYAAHFVGKVLFFRINADEAPELLTAELPAFLVYNAGQPVPPPFTLEQADLLRRQIYRLLYP
jgi:putative thioredoxin